MGGCGIRSVDPATEMLPLMILNTKAALIFLSQPVLQSFLRCELRRGHVRFKGARALCHLALPNLQFHLATA